MALFSSLELNSFEDLFVSQIEDLYDAEKRLTTALPKMAAAANDPQLRAAFTNHLKETQVQVERLEQVFQQIGREAKAEACQAMKGLVEEGAQVIDAKGDPAVKDAALIAAAQRVEHYEMAGYGTARAFAQRLGHTNAVRLLSQTYEEEFAADKKLSQIAEASVNPAAGRARA
jgi:ferritin-like metal-binding protein YciE